MTEGQRSAESDPVGMSNRGSRWQRREPHIHAPETLLNNQFKGEGAWENYLEALEQSDPAIRAPAVTDYYLTDTYERVVEALFWDGSGHPA